MFQFTSRVDSEDILFSGVFNCRCFGFFLVITDVTLVKFELKSINTGAILVSLLGARLLAGFFGGGGALA